MAPSQSPSTQDLISQLGTNITNSAYSAYTKVSKKLSAKLPSLSTTLSYAPAASGIAAMAALSLFQDGEPDEPYTALSYFKAGGEALLMTAAYVGGTKAATEGIGIGTVAWRSGASQWKKTFG